MKYRATTKRGNTILVGDILADKGNMTWYLENNDEGWGLILSKDLWDIETIVNLPSKKYAVIELNRVAYWHGAPYSDRWVDRIGNTYSTGEIYEFAEANPDKIKVIFEGVED